MCFTVLVVTMKHTGLSEEHMWFQYEKYHLVTIKICLFSISQFLGQDNLYFPGYKYSGTYRLESQKLCFY